MLVCDILKEQSLSLLDIWTLTIRDARLKGNAPRAHANFLGRSLVSWSSKKQNSVALSTAEAEYISTGGCCPQILWIKATLNDFEIKFKKVSLLCDNESAIKLTNNPVQHARTKHIDVHHYFIRDHQQKGTFALRVWTPKINLPTYSPSHLMRRGFVSYGMS
jgi:hypothetical protein